MANISDCKIHSVHFEPDNIDIVVDEGANLMETAVAAGVHINASCGGAGVCGTCNVLVRSGQVKAPKRIKSPTGTTKRV